MNPSYPPVTEHVTHIDHAPKQLLGCERTVYACGTSQSVVFKKDGRVVATYVIDPSVQKRAAS